MAVAVAPEAEAVEAVAVEAVAVVVWLSPLVNGGAGSVDN
jgi:hypothetical protein